MSGPASKGLTQPLAVFMDDKENLNPFGQQQAVHGLPGSGQQPGTQLLKAPPRPSSSSVPKGRTPLADITKLCVGSVSAAGAAATAAQQQTDQQLPPAHLSQLMETTTTLHPAHNSRPFEAVLLITLFVICRKQCHQPKWSCPWGPCSSRYVTLQVAPAASVCTVMECASIWPAVACWQAVIATASAYHGCHLGNCRYPKAFGAAAAAAASQPTVRHPKVRATDRVVAAWYHGCAAVLILSVAAVIVNSQQSEHVLCPCNMESVMLLC